MAVGCFGRCVFFFAGKSDKTPSPVCTKSNEAHSFTGSGVGSNRDCPIDVLACVSTKARVFVSLGFHELVESTTTKITSVRTLTVAGWCQGNENGLPSFVVAAPYVCTQTNKYSHMHPSCIKDAITPDYEVLLAGCTGRSRRASHKRQACIRSWTSLA